MSKGLEDIISELSSLAKKKPLRDDEPKRAKELVKSLRKRASRTRR